MSFGPHHLTLPACLPAVPPVEACSGGLPPGPCKVGGQCAVPLWLARKFPGLLACVCVVEHAPGLPGLLACVCVVEHSSWGGCTLR